MTDERRDEFPEVILYSPGFSVTIKGATSVDHAIAEAERLMDKFAPKVPQSGPIGFAQVERRDVPEVQPSSMPCAPRDAPQRPPGW